MGGRRAEGRKSGVKKQQADAHKKQIAIAQKERQQANKLNTQRPSQSPHPREKTRLLPTIWKWSVRGVVALGVIAGLVGFAYQFRPQLSIEPDITLNSRDPFATQFRITNIGSLSLYDLRFACTLNSPPLLKNITILNSSGQSSVPVLRPQDSATKSCSVIADNYPYLTDLEFAVSFHPPLVKWSLTITRHFANMRDSEGRLRWVPQPESSK